jgi:hypothetical protein
VLLAGVAFGHDFWLAPSKFRVAKGETVDVALRFGVEYAGEVSLRDDLRIEKFVVLGPDGTEDVRGEDGKDPAGVVKPVKDGIYVVAFRSKRRSIEIEASSGVPEGRGARRSRDPARAQGTDRRGARSTRAARRRAPVRRAADGRDASPDASRDRAGDEPLRRRGGRRCLPRRVRGEAARGRVRRRPQQGGAKHRHGAPDAKTA